MQKVYWQKKKSPVHTWPRIMRLRVLGCSLSTTPIAFDDWTNILSPEYTMEIPELVSAGVNHRVEILLPLPTLHFCLHIFPIPWGEIIQDNIKVVRMKENWNFRKFPKIVVLCSVERLHHHFRSMCSSVNWELRRRRMSEVEYKGASEGC